MILDQFQPSLATGLFPFRRKSSGRYDLMLTVKPLWCPLIAAVCCQ